MASWAASRSASRCFNSFRSGLSAGVPSAASAAALRASSALLNSPTSRASSGSFGVKSALMSGGQQLGQEPMTLWARCHVPPTNNVYAGDLMQGVSLASPAVMRHQYGRLAVMKLP